MKYTYAYKTPDGVRHEDAMNASSREEVFEALRAKGIKAIKVVAADGSKANGEVRGVRKRVVAVLVALAAVCVGVVAYIGGERTGANVAANPEVSSPRHQIYGDPAVMEGLERGDFGEVLPREGDRMLAVFAQPGKFMCAKGANPRYLAAAQDAAFAAYAKDELAPERDIVIAPEDPREIKELKQIVNGMREELRGYLANPARSGGGSMNAPHPRCRSMSARAASLKRKNQRKSGRRRTPPCAASASAPSPTRTIRVDRQSM